MISFELSEEQKLAQVMVQQMAAGALRPAAREADERQSIPPPILDRIWSTEIVQSSAASGPGAEPSATLNAILLEELAAADASFAFAAGAPIGFLSAIVAGGSAAQKNSLLHAFRGAGYRCAAVALMEPGFCFDPSALRTTAVRSGSSYRLSGAKGSVPLAAACSHFLVIANCEGAPAAFIVDRELRGVAVGASNPRLGLRALEMATVTFTDVELSAAARLGEGARSEVQRIVDSGRTALAAIMTGLSRAVMEFVIPYTKERVVHGAPLAQKQVIAFRLADMRIETDAMRWMTWKASSMLERDADATREAQLAYTYAGEQAMWIADEGVQMLGGHGYLRDNPVEMWYRDARTISVMEGAAGV